MLASTDASASLRQTSRLRCHTGVQRSVSSGAAQMLVIRGSFSIAQLAAGELDEQILEIGGAMLIAHAVVPLQHVQQRLRIAGVAECRLAGDLDAIGDAAADRLAPAARLV